MRASIEEIRINEQRKRECHSRFLRDLSTYLLSSLFLELGIADYKVGQVFIEPRMPPWRGEVSPDLVIAYNDHSPNLLIVEAKVRLSRSCSRKMEEQLSYLRHFVESPSGNESLYHLLEEKIPIETIYSCGIVTAGVYATKHGRFKVYRTERIR
jgi:hypothetical protein